MFLDLTDSQRALQAELRAYFGGLITPAERELMLTQRHGAVYRDVVRRMGRDGWLGVGWPAEYGGRGFGQVEQQIFVNEAALADVPLPAVTLQTVGPTLMARGSAGQKDFFLPRILAGELHFAIGYTEPGAGTDLAALTTRAVLDGDTYIVNGQKIFTTGGHDADYVWLACRTDPDAPKHKGLSILIVDTADPGYSWTPIITHDGAHHVNATYYSDVRVPVSMRVGEENSGWRLITAQLNHERVMLGPSGRIGVLHARVRDWAARQAGHRDQLALHLVHSSAEGHHGVPLALHVQPAGQLGGRRVSQVAVAPHELYQLLAEPLDLLRPENLGRGRVRDVDRLGDRDLPVQQLVHPLGGGGAGQRAADVGPREQRAGVRAGTVGR